MMYSKINPVQFLRFFLLSMGSYDVPERSKHRKRSLQNLSSDTLKAHSHSLFSILQGSYWKRKHWQGFHVEVQSLAGSITQYTDYLNRQNKKMLLRHVSEVPMRNLADSMSISYHKATTQSLLPLFLKLDAAIENAGEYDHFSLNEFIPDDPRKRYEFLQSLSRNGIRFPIIICTHSSGNNTGNTHFVWRVPNTGRVEEIFSRSQQVVERIRPQLPIFHTRVMRKTMFSKFGRVAPTIKPS